MSAPATSRMAPSTALDWRLLATQAGRIARMELRKNFFTRRGFWIYLLAFAPVPIFWVHALVEKHGSMTEDTLVLAAIVQVYYLRLAIFFGSMGIFTRLIRGEMVERTLHFYLLSPIRREVIIVGKFLAGIGTAVSLFALAVIMSFAGIYATYGRAGTQYVFDGPGLGQLLAYLGVTVLACTGYGALFMLLSIVFKNPIVPGMLLLGWETINPVLPPLSQKLSVVFYLRHLMPVQVPFEGIFALLTVVTEPVPAWMATVGVLCVAGAAVSAAAVLSRKLQINYSSD
jgi:ABC-type transport system involved in multi-copper enzyme maturation permease subunit